VLFTIYNVNLNLFGATRLTVEFTAAGAVVPYSDISVFKAIRYFSSYDYFLLALEILIIIYFFFEFMLPNALRVRSTTFFVNFSLSFAKNDGNTSWKCGRGTILQL
jgi:hypothetical protein